MNPAKIRLSEVEMDLVKNADWILTKNAIISKVQQLLAQLSTAQQQEIATSQYDLPARVLRYAPKISRGENYRGLPYMVLDYPRCFEQQDIFAIRTMFWWGHHFSTTLHLSGVYKSTLEKKLIPAYKELRNMHGYIGIDEDQWQHHFGNDNYRLIAELNADQFSHTVTGQPFCKIAIKTLFDPWEELPKKLMGNYRFLAGIVAG